MSRGRGPKHFTVAEIAAEKGVSDSQARRKLKGIVPAGGVDGYNGRTYAGYSRTQIAEAFPKPAKKA